MSRDDLHVSLAHREERRDEPADRDVRLVVDRRRGRAHEEPAGPLAADLVPVGAWDDADLELEGVSVDQMSV
jgi:hypothetical protein